MKSLRAHFTTADKILFTFSLSLIVVSYFYFWQTDPARYAIIKTPQQETLLVDLNIPQKHQVQGSLGVSTLEVKQGQIRFISSPCKNKICIQSGWHQHGGSLSACVPNRISVQLTSNNATTHYDAIIF